MNRFLAVTTCVALLCLALPAAAKDKVYPGFQLEPNVGHIKASYSHTGGEMPEDHDGNPATNGPMPWFWHPAQPYQNVAGVRFTIRYDSYEANIVGINNLLGTLLGPFDGPFNLFDPPPPPPESQEAKPATVMGTMWVNHNVGSQSGVSLGTSEPIPLFTLAYQPRHTSKVSNAQYNSDIDIRVTNLTPIYHVTESSFTGSFWSYNPGTDGQPGTLQHVTIDVGKFLRNGQSYASPTFSDSAPTIKQVQRTSVISGSVWARASESSVTLQTVAGGIRHWGPGGIPLGQSVHIQGATLTGTLIGPSSFYVGSPIGGLNGGASYYGLGIDHVPEPVTLVLLGMGGLCLFVQTCIRRRRRTT